MEEALITFETAKLAKCKYFESDKYPKYAYDGLLVTGFTNAESASSAPTQSLLQKWLREKHNIQIVIHPTFSEPMKYITFVNREYVKNPELKEMGDIGRNSGVMLDHVISETYEQALEGGLKEALKLIK